MNQGPLAGLRVIDCTWGTAGSFATGQLADYGADVIRIEPPGGDPFDARLHIAYKVYHRGKRTHRLDLKAAAGRAQLEALLAGADVFVHSWRPGVAERLGLGWDELHRRHPALVYGAISGYGAGDARPGYEGPVQAAAGMMAEQQGLRDGPIFNGLPFASLGAGYLLALGVVAALYRRQRDGGGRRVDTSLFDGALVQLAMLWLSSEVPAFYPRVGMPFRTLAAPYRCGDGLWLGVHTGAVGAFNRCMDALGLGAAFAVSDGRDLGVPLTPEQHRLVLDEIPQIFASRPRAQWLEILLAADVCAIPVLAPGAVFDEPQIRHNGMAVAVHDAELGELTEVGIAAKFSVSPAAVTAPAPGALAWREAALAAPPGAAAAADAGAAPLSGVRILDLGAYYAGPFGSRLLASLGAEVIKLEMPAGDPMRGLDRAFCAAAQNKRSIAVDLKQEAGREIGQRLAAWADIVSHNMRPGAAERLGLDYASIRAGNPAVIYAYSPGWGSSGPDAQRQGFAPLYSGYTGVMFELAGAGNPPVHPLGNEDTGNGLLGALGMVMALYYRARTGRGQQVEHPQLDATLLHMAHVVRTRDGRILGRSTLDRGQYGLDALQRLYRTRDGWLCLHVRERQWPALQRILELPAAAPDAAAIAAAFARIDTAAALAALQAADIAAEIPCGENWENYLNDPRNQRSGRVLVSSHPRLGALRGLGHFLRVGDGAPVDGFRAPLLGEHSREILRQLGYAAADVERLVAAGSVRAA